jgi:signal peptidase II
MTRHKRRIKLIQPRLQLKLIFVFLGMAASSMLLQFILFTSNVTEVATALPADGLILVEELPALLYRTLLVSFLLFLPLMFFVGVLVTFRIAGPLYRFEVYLKQVIRGEKPNDCRLRKGDELQHLCQLINEATAPLRVRAETHEDSAAASGAESTGGLERAA